MSTNKPSINSVILETALVILGKYCQFSTLFTQIQPISKALLDLVLFKLTSTTN